MQVLKFDLEIPYWCSFKQYGTMNIQQTYPFPPPPTIFGMIQNALGKPQQDYRGYEKLRFAIIIRNNGEKLDDYSNIMKGNRGKNSRSALKDELSSKLKDLEKQLKKENFSEEQINWKLKKYEKKFWEEKRNEFGAYAIEKMWMRTQVRRQKIINPTYTIFLKSDDTDEYSLKNISHALMNPKRPLYLGESDDLVIIQIEGGGIRDAKPNKSSQIKSVIIGIYENSHVVKIPNTIRDYIGEKASIVTSIPKGEIQETIPCFNVDGEYIVFL
jgi:CRISPR-associated protein Cas5 subtype I-B